MNDITKERHNGAHRYVVLMVTVDSDPGFLLLSPIWILTVDSDPGFLLFFLICVIGRCDVEA